MVATKCHALSSIRLPSNISDSRIEHRSAQGLSFFPSCLFFITLQGKLDCIASKAMAWALDKVASNEALGPGERLVHAMNGEKEEAAGYSYARKVALESIRQLTIQRYPPKMTTVQLLNLLTELKLDQQIVVI